jgi:hypothetical protein
MPKKYTATDEVIMEGMKIIGTYSLVYCHVLLMCSYFVIKSVVSYEEVLQV